VSSVDDKSGVEEF